MSINHSAPRHSFSLKFGHLIGKIGLDSQSTILRDQANLSGCFKQALITPLLASILSKLQQRYLCSIHFFTMSSLLKQYLKL